MLTALAAVVLFGGVLALGVFMFRFQHQRGEELLEAWAERQGYRLLSREPANPPGTGPMHRSAADKRVVYRVRVADDAGQVREGTVRVGAALTGVLSDDVAVEWDRDFVPEDHKPRAAPANEPELGVRADDFGIPFYPGAVQDPERTQRATMGDYQQLQAGFTSADAPDKIAAFYRKRLATMAADTGVLAETESEGKLSLILKRDDRHVIVVAIEAAEAGGSEIQLSTMGTAVVRGQH